MPELPEVNTFQRYFDGTSLHQKIVEVPVQDDKIIKTMSGEAFSEQLCGRTFTGSYRRGKYLFAKIDNGHHLLLHFGMTGDLKYYQELEEQPRHERFAFLFENGFRLGFDCPRKFARIQYIPDLGAYLEKTGLGEDALVISEEQFLQQAEGKKGSLKGFLLDQHQMAGVGNLYADEICYRTRLHPASRLNKLSKPQLKSVFQAMQKILQFAIDRNATYRHYPDDWLWNWRTENGPSPDGKGVMKRAKVAGRTTYFCEERQRLWE